MEKLKFRRQFVLCDQELNAYRGWNGFSFTAGEKDWHIQYHPDLNFSVKCNEDHTVILLGYILDPKNPGHNHDEILSTLITKKDLDEIIMETKGYNGRFIIIFFNARNLCLFHDLTGFRELYYSFTGKLTACGSTPNILADQLNLGMTEDPEIKAFYEAKRLNKRNYTWIGYKTIIDNVLHLAPNHYIDLLSRKVVRYWPKASFPKTSIDACIRESAEILKGTIAAAVNRYSLHMGITAGWDTRLLLAASRDYKDRIYYYVNKQPFYSNNHTDIRIPKKLAKRLGFNLNIVGIKVEVPPEFKVFFFGNNVLSDESLLPVYYTVYERNWENTFTVSGTMGNGLARVYHPLAKNTCINGKTVAGMLKYKNNTYVTRELNDWCNKVLPLCDSYNINIMDLFQLEQENPHWASLSSAEQDIVREEIRPFNNRRLIELFWSMDDIYRYQYYPVIYIKIIECLWNDVLKVPVNPSFRTLICRILRILGIERSVYSYYKKLRQVNTW